MGRSSAALYLSILFLTACARVDPAADFAKVADISQDRLGQRPTWVRTAEEEALVAAEVRAVLARGVGLGDAVRLALVHDPGLQARFEEIGLARSEVVQAGLPKNPSLAALFGFPLFSGGPLAALAVQAMVSVSDLAELRDREAKAQAELEREVLLVGHEAMVLAREAKLAWLEAAFALQARKWAREVAAKVKKLAAAARRYEQFGLADTARVAALTAGVARAELAERELSARAAVAKARLGRAMGLVGEPDFDLAGEPPDSPARLPEAGQALDYALANNLEIQAARYLVTAAKSGQELEKVRWLKDFQVGAGYDYDIEGNRSLGPGASLALPIFDANTARKAKAAHLVRQAERLLEKARAEAREAVLRAVEDASLARATVEGLTAGVLPQVERASAWAGRYARAMQLSELTAIEAELDLLRERLALTEATFREQAALVRLEYALGGPLGPRRGEPVRP